MSEVRRWFAGVASGLASKFYVAFLLAAGVPVAVAGLVGIYYSVEALKKETLHHLDREVSGRAAEFARVFDHVTGGLLLLSKAPVVTDLVNAEPAAPDPVRQRLRERVEWVFAAFARAYPYTYQVRYLGTDGSEVVRVDRVGERVHMVAVDALQNKSQRYYVQAGLVRESGQVYVSPLDLNVEHGVVERPERPVIRFATPVLDRSGNKHGLLIINLHADFVLGQIQEMAAPRGGRAYLFDRSGSFISRTADKAEQPSVLHMRSIDALEGMFSRALLESIGHGARGTEVLGDWIIAYAPVAVGRTLADRTDAAVEWTIASAFPRKYLFEAVFNLYLLYGVLALCLVATALGGYALSRHLLRPLSELSSETEAIAQGDFSHRVIIRGRDEIAELGTRFNAMAARLEQSYRSLEEQKGRLAEEVRARTAELEGERRSLATIIDSTADGLLALDAHGIVKLANGAAVRIFGTDRTELVGHHVRALWPGWDAFLAGYDRLDPTSVPRLDLQVHGRTLSLSVAAVAPRDAPQGWIVALRDVSEERGLQDAQRELDRQMFQREKLNTLGELAMGLAHEIGNPLAGMKTVTQALLDDADLTPRARRYLARFEGEVDRLAAFLRTFHGFAAPQDGQPTACRLEDALDDVLLWTRKEARSKGISIALRDCAGKIPALWADPNQLKQLLLNLVINAVHAIAKDGHVWIGACSAGAGSAADGRLRAKFCVEDDGPGIPAAVLPRIFEPFFTTRPDGSGLGLAIVRKIADQHGADIHVASEPGRGTRFELVWPLADQSVEPRTTASGRSAAAEACPRRAAHG
ncbi:MAG: ATP-binding protein [Burkholderiales bacterium]|nr:ATP-binding protein [Burkholderiales bacterium]